MASNRWLNSTLINRIKEKTIYEEDCRLYIGQPSHIKEYDAPQVMEDGVLYNIGQWALRYFSGIFDPTRLVCHTCDKARCWNPAHLYLGTHESNAEDKIYRKRYVSFKGSSNPTAKINEETAIKIKLRLKRGRSMASISRKLEVPYDVVRHISNGTSWAHVVV